jgi:predicted SprT family Zn-dependent metalloprotease
VIAPTALESEFRSALGAAGRALFIVDWPTIPVRWNKRLRRAGRAVIDTRRSQFVGARIELSPTYFEVYPADLGGILVHEAVHIGLALQGRPFGHGPEFRRACVTAGGLLHSRWLPGRVFRYQCPICEMVLERRRRASDSRWCAECVGTAEGGGLEPYVAGRAMRLIETVYCGPEQPARPPAAPFEQAPECGPKGAPVRYPVGGVGEPDSEARAT